MANVQLDAVGIAVQGMFRAEIVGFKIDLFAKIAELIDGELYRDPPIAICAPNAILCRFRDACSQKTNACVRRVEGCAYEVMGIPVSRDDRLSPTSLAFVGRVETRVFDMDVVST